MPSSETVKHVTTAKQFIPFSQLSVMSDCLRGEEKEFFIDKFAEYAERFENMHKTYEQDGKGDEAIVHLRYFSLNSNAVWYITEKDMEDEQHQAFGLVNLGIGFPDSVGYISIPELQDIATINLDLHFTPCTMGELKAERAK